MQGNYSYRLIYKISSLDLRIKRPCYFSEKCDPQIKICIRLDNLLTHVQIKIYAYLINLFTNL